MTTQLHQAYMYLQLGQPRAALDLLLSLPKSSDPDPNIALIKGIAQSQIGDKASAVVTYQELLRTFPKHPAALLNMGADLFVLERLDEALNALNRAQEVDPINPMVALNLGNVHRALHRLDDALKCYDYAISLNHNYSEARSNRGDILCLKGRFSEAINEYKEAISLNPKNSEALHNLGLTYIELNNLGEGINLVKDALALRPEFAVAYNSLGIGLARLQNHSAAIAAYQRAIALTPDLPDPYFNLADIYAERRDFLRAIENYKLSLVHSKEPTSKLAYLLHTKMKVCDWTNYVSLTNQLIEGLVETDTVISPFTIIGLPSLAAAQKDCAKKLSKKIYPTCQNKLHSSLTFTPPIKDKIRVGYLSCDFYRHATAYLIAELFELHDRERFEIHAFSYGAGPNDDMRARLVGAVDNFHHLKDLSDMEIADQIKASQIDILVDLKGHTQKARLGPMCHRPAPIQAHYLGYPGTLGTEFVDYLIADDYLINDKDYVHYSEKIVHLPGSYQVNDRQRKISQKLTTRSEHGLPDTGFVFCCFNNNWKITPEIFNVWIRLLCKVPTSTLWLLADNPYAESNLKLEAQRRGVNPERLVFAPKLLLPEHLERHRHADIFLDTPYCNAHTTASDALWAGLPLLTLKGSTFAGRVSGSLLSALNMPDMIAHDLNTYETKALEIASDSKLAKNLRTRLKDAIGSTSLFDTPKFTRHLEKAYEAMIERWMYGEPPNHIRIAS